jgi:hypothetical protein
MKFLLAAALSCCFLLFHSVDSVAQHKRKDLSEDDIKVAYSSIPKIDGQYEYSEVIQLDSASTKDLLYQRAKLFFANEFKSAKDVIQYDDRGEGKVIGKGHFRIEDIQLIFLVAFTEKRDVNFTLEVFCKDGRYRYRIYGFNAEVTLRASGGSGPDNITHSEQSIDASYALTQKGSTKKMDRRLFSSTLFEIQRIAEDLKKAMATSTQSDNF